MESKYYKKLVGDRLYLSPMSVEDAHTYCQWLNDLSVTMHLDAINQVYTMEKEKEFIAKPTSDYHFSIIESKTDKLLGSVGLYKVDLINRTAEFGIFIGDKGYWNAGYGTEATTLILDFAFNILNIHHIHLQVIGFNKRAMRSYEKVGFRQVGKLSEFRLIAGERFDMIIMEILARDFKSDYIKKTFAEVKSQKPTPPLPPPTKPSKKVKQGGAESRVIPPMKSSKKVKQGGAQK